MIIRMHHLREVGICSAGARAFFDRHGLDWAAFVRDGVCPAVLESTGDALGVDAVARIRSRHG